MFSIVLHLAAQTAEGHCGNEAHAPGHNSSAGFVYIMKKITVWFTGAVLLAVVLLLVRAIESRNMPELQIWHTASLTNEFTVDDATPQSTLQDYLDQEERLFSELQQKVYAQVPPITGVNFSRYSHAQSQDPQAQPHNWNRSFELVPDKIKAGALLLHGLTDSPYSLRRIGELLQAQGFYVLGLRLPGHGTIPGALTQVHWQDWVAASRIGAHHVRQRIGSQNPLVIAGYSNGGALAVKYSLDALADDSLPKPQRLLLFSPEIGIKPIAAFSNSHLLLSFLPWFEQFKWLDIEPEYDPFKYNSFPKNAAQQAYEITTEVQGQMQKLRQTGRFRDFPRTLTFLSWADNTVNTTATIERFYDQLDQLESTTSELIVFDVNRFDSLALFLPSLVDAPLDRLALSGELRYRLTVITNVARNSQSVASYSKAQRSSEIVSKPLELTWPWGLYSLSHVAIPFSPDDPIYGDGSVANKTYLGLPLGALQPRGETQLLTAPLDQLMRLRYNPFFSYLQRRIELEIAQLLNSS